MKKAAVLSTVLGLAALVTASPILRPDAAAVDPSSKNDLAQRSIFDGLLEDLFSTLNYPDDMTKGSTDLENMSGNDRGMALDAVALENRDAFEAYIDDMDDDAVRKALSSPRVYNAIYNGPKGAVEINVDNESDLGIFTLLPGSDGNKYDSRSTDNTEIDVVHDTGIAKRDSGGWCHNKCRFKAAFHHDMDKYYCGCLNQCIHVDDLIPDCCKEILADSPIPDKRSIDDKAHSAIDVVEAIDVVDASTVGTDFSDDTELDAHLTKRSGDWCHTKCNLKAAWHHDMEKYYCKCYSKCVKDDDLVPDCCKDTESCKDQKSPVLVKDSIDSTVESVDTVDTLDAVDAVGKTNVLTDLDIDLTKRSKPGKPRYGSANPCNSASEVAKCRFKAGWSPFSFKKHYEKCMRKCNRKHGHGA